MTPSLPFGGRAAARLGALCAILGLCAGPLGPPASAAGGGALTPGRTGRAAALASFGAGPLAFEPNRGQAAANLAFLARGQGYGVGLSATGATLFLGASSLHLVLLGANPAARGVGQGRLPGTVGYLSARAARPGLAALPTYAAVRYTAVYPGIDLLYYGTGRHLDYDALLAPGADPRRVRLAFPDALTLSIAANGDLVVRGAGGVVRQHAPVLYQIDHGARRTVQGRYRLLGGHTAGIWVGAYDRHRPLVIDPALVYSTYFGNHGDTIAEAIAVDGHGDVYITGNTNSPPDKTRVVFISKFDPTGRALYTKFISNRYGKTTTACNSIANGIAVDSQGAAYVTGTYGDHPDGEDTACGNDNILWARVDPAGHVAVTTFGTNGGNSGAAIAVDAHGNSYITGSTSNRPNAFPVTTGSFQPTAGIDRIFDAGVAGDAFVLKVDASGHVLYGTYLGGSGIDSGTGIAVDDQGNAYVVGTTGIEPTNRVLNFPLTRTAFQVQARSLWSIGFLSKLSADGSRLLYSTLLDGNDGERPSAVAVDGHGDAYVAGETTSSTFPTTPNAFQRQCGTDGGCNVGQVCHYDQVQARNVCFFGSFEDAFVVVVDTTRAGPASLRYGTYLGGGSKDMAAAIAVDAAGRAYITGRTFSRDFPMNHSLHAGGGWDAFVAEVDPSQSGAASLPFSTYLGGTAADEGNGIAVDGAGSVYVTGDTGSQSTFPTRNATQATRLGGFDAFITKIDGLPR